MDRWLILDPTAPPAEGTRWVAPRLDRPVRGTTIGLRLDRSWRCYETIVDTWTELLEATRQIRGESGKRQLARHDTAYVTGTGGIMSEQAALIVQGA